jgi:hypothetical protein
MLDLQNELPTFLGIDGKIILEWKRKKIRKGKT